MRIVCTGTKTSSYKKAFATAREKLEDVRDLNPRPTQATRVFVVDNDIYLAKYRLPLDSTKDFCLLIYVQSLDVKGGVVGGSADTSFETFYEEGGVTSGEADVIEYYFTGIIGGGNSSVSFAFEGKGGGIASGSVSRSIEIEGSGGGVVTGYVSRLTKHDGSGGAVCSGRDSNIWGKGGIIGGGTCNLTLYFKGNGGGVVYGKVSLARKYKFVGSGGVCVTGTLRKSVAEQGTGGVRVGGAATIQYNKAYLGLGGARCSGTHSVSTYHPPISSQYISDVAITWDAVDGQEYLNTRGYLSSTLDPALPNGTTPIYTSSNPSVFLLDSPNATVGTLKDVSQPFYISAVRPIGTVLGVNYNSSNTAQSPYYQGVKYPCTITFLDLTKTYTGSDQGPGDYQIKAFGTTLVYDSRDPSYSHTVLLNIVWDDQNIEHKNAGSYGFTATINDIYYSGENTGEFLIIEKATPTIVWDLPASIPYSPTGLSLSDLDAVATFNGSIIPGIVWHANASAAGFVYYQSGVGVWYPGLVLNAGSYANIYAEFHPQDSLNFNNTSIVKSLIITKINQTGRIYTNIRDLAYSESFVVSISGGQGTGLYYVDNLYTNPNGCIGYSGGGDSPITLQAYTTPGTFSMRFYKAGDTNYNAHIGEYYGANVLAAPFNISYRNLNYGESVLPTLTNAPTGTPVYSYNSNSGSVNLNTVTGQVTAGYVDGSFSIKVVKGGQTAISPVYNIGNGTPPPIGNWWLGIWSTTLTLYADGVPYASYKFSCNFTSTATSGNVYVTNQYDSNYTGYHPYLISGQTVTIYDLSYIFYTFVGMNTNFTFTGSSLYWTDTFNTVNLIKE